MKVSGKNFLTAAFDADVDGSVAVEAFSSAIIGTAPLRNIG